MQAQALARLLTMQAPVVSNMVSATHQINSYQMDQYKENDIRAIFTGQIEIYFAL